MSHGDIIILVLLIISAQKIICSGQTISLETLSWPGIHMKNTRLSLKDNTLLVPQPQEVEELVEQVVGSTSMVVAMVEVEEVVGTFI